MYFIGTLIFTIAILASIGVFVYEKYLESRISRMEQDLAAARETLDPDLINTLSKENNRIKSAEILIDNHVTLTALFDVLEKITLQDVAYTSFNLRTTEADNQGIAINLGGVTRTYAALALQADIFANDPNFLTYNFLECLYILLFLTQS